MVLLIWICNVQILCVRFCSMTSGVHVSHCLIKLKPSNTYEHKQQFFPVLLEDYEGLIIKANNLSNLCFHDHWEVKTNGVMWQEKKWLMQLRNFFIVVNSQLTKFKWKQFWKSKLTDLFEMLWSSQIKISLIKERF